MKTKKQEFGFHAFLITCVTGKVTKISDTHFLTYKMQTRWLPVINLMSLTSKFTFHCVLLGPTIVSPLPADMMLNFINFISRGCYRDTRRGRCFSSWFGCALLAGCLHHPELWGCPVPELPGSQWHLLASNMPRLHEQLCRGCHHPHTTL